MRTFSETSSECGSRAGFPAASSSFFVRIADFVRARWAASSSRRRARTSMLARRAARGWRTSMGLGLVDLDANKGQHVQRSDEKESRISEYHQEKTIENYRERL